jgi:hypothetical protein
VVVNYSNTPLLQSSIGSLAGSSHNTVSFLLQIVDTDITTPTEWSPTGVACNLQLVNYSVQPITLVGSGGSGNVNPQITASVLVMEV